MPKGAANEVYKPDSFQISGKDKVGRCLSSLLPVVKVMRLYGNRRNRILLQNRESYTDNLFERERADGYSGCI